MTGDYDQRTPSTHMHPSLVRDSSGHIDTFGLSAADWFTPQVPADGSPVAEVGERARAATVGRLRAFAGELYVGFKT